MLFLVAAAIGSYLVGAIPFSYLIPKIFFGIDIRQHGSGNVGATNVVRVVGKPVGITCFVLDVLKGIVPVVALRAMPGLPDWAPLVGAAGAVVGHAKSVFLRFGGGKAVATGVGTILALSPFAGVVCLVIWLVAFLPTRVVSIASITAALALPGAMIGLPNPIVAGGRSPEVYVYYAMAAGFYVIVRHRENIRRIFAGTEHRFGASTEENNERN
jgi:glycerol-3-phosphate acyltransferase PlsY